MRGKTARRALSARCLTGVRCLSLPDVRALSSRCASQARRVVTLAGAFQRAVTTRRCTAAFGAALRCDAMRCDATRCDACSRNHLSIAATTCTSSHERSTRSSAAYLDVEVCTTLHLACRSDAATYDTPHLYDVCHIRLSCMLTRAWLHTARCTLYIVFGARCASPARSCTCCMVPAFSAQGPLTRPKPPRGFVARPRPPFSVGARYSL